MAQADQVEAVNQPPRTIYSLWLQGIENAPSLARLNFDRWARLNPGYRMEVLDQTSVIQLLAQVPIPLDQLAPQALSDVVRAFLLSKSGGVWVDASVYPMKALDDWLPSHMTSSGFFAFERPGPDRPVSSWFLAATVDNLMMQLWWEEVLNYWSVIRVLKRGIPDDPVAAVSDCTNSYPYFWFHYLFQLLLDRNPDFRAGWENCLKSSAEPPHRMHSRIIKNENIPQEELLGIAAQAPVHKLKWQAPYSTHTLAALRSLQAGEPSSAGRTDGDGRRG